MCKVTLAPHLCNVVLIVISLSNSMVAILYLPCYCYTKEKMRVLQITRAAQLVADYFHVARFQAKTQSWWTVDDG